MTVCVALTWPSSSCLYSVILTWPSSSCLCSVVLTWPSSSCLYSVHVVLTWPSSSCLYSVVLTSPSSSCLCISPSCRGNAPEPSNGSDRRHTVTSSPAAQSTAVARQSSDDSCGRTCRHRYVERGRAPLQTRTPAHEYPWRQTSTWTRRTDQS